MREFDAPLTVYVASDFAEGTGRLWWVALERVIAEGLRDRGRRSAAPPSASIPTTPAGQAGGLRPAARLAARTARRARSCSARSSALCARHGVDEAAICRDLCLSWDELKPFAADPLVTIGAHTITHCNLAQADARRSPAHEIATSRARIEDALQRPVLHFAYPYGDRAAAGPREFALARAAGFKTAVTTRPGMIFPENAEHLTALPRVSLNGNYQDARILPVLTSGAATAMWNGFRRVDAA